MNCRLPSIADAAGRMVAPLCLLLVSLSGSAAAQQPTITGVIRDQTGAVISGATVVLRSSHSSLTTTSGGAGEFSFFNIADVSGIVRATAIGFSPAEQAWSITSGATEINLMLRASADSERVVVSATRSPLKLSEVPGSAVRLSTTDIAANPSLNLDDVLRQVPGFSLFRRSSSRTANPTTQGVSLRGLGASGPSRALVLEDGVPLVDPFGGWVYWDRVPRAELSSVEVFRGGASSLYGSNALGGVAQFLTRVPTRSYVSVDTSYGTETTPDLSISAGSAISRWDFESAIDMSRTDGYILVPKSQRGTVDTTANSEHATVDAGIGYKLSDTGRAFLRGSLFDESRKNGTPLQKNSTKTGFGVAGLNSEIGSHDSITARVFGLAQGYDQTFSSIQSTRNHETLTNIQHVPSQQLGANLQWQHVLKNHSLIAGIDAQEIMGASDEQLVLASAVNIAGGRQRTTGMFAQDIFHLAAKWTLIAGVRWDDWKNFGGSTVRFPNSGQPVGTVYSDRSESSFSPRLSIMRTLNNNVSVSLSGYRAFRAPTLNELYRSFQQGVVITKNDPLLRAERLTGAEAGIKATAGRLESRSTLFWGDIVNPVTNVTLSTTPQIIRQRQNLGRTRSFGVELDGAFHLSSAVEFSGGYQYTHATVANSPTLAGKRLPEVPSHQVTWEARYWNPSRVMLSLEGRYSGAQFDDDLNTLVLNHYYVMQLLAGRQLCHGLTGYVAAENLFNQRYATALSPPTGSTPSITTLGTPILARVGLRYEFPSAQK